MGSGDDCPLAGRLTTFHPSASPLAGRRGHQIFGNNGARGARQTPGLARRPAARPDTGQGGRAGLQHSLVCLSLLTRLCVAAILPTLARLRGASPTPAPFLGPFGPDPQRPGAPCCSCPRSRPQVTSRAPPEGFGVGRSSRHLPGALPVSGGRPPKILAELPRSPPGARASMPRWASPTLALPPTSTPGTPANTSGTRPWARSPGASLPGKIPAGLVGETDRRTGNVQGEKLVPPRLLSGNRWRACAGRGEGGSEGRAPEGEGRRQWGRRGCSW